MRRLLGPATAALLLVLAGCSADAGTVEAGHSHAGGAAHTSLAVGDGTSASEVGYSLDDVRLSGGASGEVSFRVVDFEGRAVTDYVEELTKDLHLYVVRDDLAVFRHVHPTMAEDGTWTAPVSLPAGGDYRVITELIARDSGGNGDHVVLGETVAVPGDEDGAPEPRPLLQVEVTEEPVAGRNGRLVLRVLDDQDRPVRIGTYLGAYGHATGFHLETGAMVHMHPLGPAETTDQGSELTFHTEVEQAGDYLLFLQVRVDGLLHTVPVPLTVAGSSSGA